MGPITPRSTTTSRPFLDEAADQSDHTVTEPVGGPQRDPLRGVVGDPPDPLRDRTRQLLHQPEETLGIWKGLFGEQPDANVALPHGDGQTARRIPRKRRIAPWAHSAWSQSTVSLRTACGNSSRTHASTCTGISSGATYPSSNCSRSNAASNSRSTSNSLARGNRNSTYSVGAGPYVSTTVTLLFRTSILHDAPSCRVARTVPYLEWSNVNCCRTYGYTLPAIGSSSSRCNRAPGRRNVSIR